MDQPSFCTMGRCEKVDSTRYLRRALVRGLSSTVLQRMATERRADARDNGDVFLATFHVRSKISLSAWLPTCAGHETNSSRESRCVVHRLFVIAGLRD